MKAARMFKCITYLSGTYTHTHTRRRAHTDHHSLVSHNSTRHHGILHINWCSLAAIFTPLQPLRQIHYSLISHTWPFIKLGHVKQPHRAGFFFSFTDSKSIFLFFRCFLLPCEWLQLNVLCIQLVTMLVCEWIYVRKYERELPFSSFLSKGLPLLHVRSAQRAGRTQHCTKDNSHQEQRQIKDQLQRHQMERKWKRNLLKTPSNSTQASN